MASEFSSWSSCHSGAEFKKLGQENTCLRNMLDEVSHHKGATSDSQDNQVYLERILALETLREKNSQQIVAKDQEIEYLWQLIRSDSTEVMPSLCAQLNQQQAEAEKRERLMHALEQKTESVKNKLTALSEKCQVLENTSKRGFADGQTATRNSTLVQDELKDALEKNQHWLVYDQQREGYVKAVLADLYQLKLELHQAKKGLRQKNKDIDLQEKREVEIQQCYDMLKGELEKEQQKGLQLRTEHHKLKKELEEERLKSAEFQQQIQLSVKDLEDKKLDNQHLQWQLHRVLKELGKAMDKVVTLESKNAKRETASSVSNAYTELKRIPKESPRRFPSPTRAHNLLDESFLECPNCRIQYPTSRYRHLLVHIDQCVDTN